MACSDAGQPLHDDAYRGIPGRDRPTGDGVGVAARRLRLSVLLDSGAGNALRLDTLADQYRDDLKAAGKGDGRYGFALPVPAAFAEREHDVDVHVPDFPGVRLNGTPRRAISALPPVTLRAIEPVMDLDMPPGNRDVDRLRGFLA